MISKQMKEVISIGQNKGGITLIELRSIYITPFAAKNAIMWLVDKGHFKRTEKHGYFEYLGGEPQ